MAKFDVEDIGKDVLDIAVTVNALKQAVNDNEEIKNSFETAKNSYLDKFALNENKRIFGYVLKYLAMFNGLYFNTDTNTFDKCRTFEDYSKDVKDGSCEYEYDRYIREKLYPSSASTKLGFAGYWTITDAPVTIPTNKTIVVMSGETGSEMDEYGSFDIAGEQGAENSAIPAINISPTINVDELTDGDNSDDKFVYAYSDLGKSKNKRDWSGVADSIAQQVLDKCPVAHFGHLKPDDAGFKMPMPVITWIGSATQPLVNGITRLWLKGYVLPTDEGKKFKTLFKGKAVNSISVYGLVKSTLDEKTGLNKINSVDLKSIDISGKLKEGLPSGIVQLASEMESPAKENIIVNKSKEENNMSLTDVTLSQIKAENPKLYGEMKAEILSDIKAQMANEELTTKAGEMDALTKEYGDVKAFAKEYKAFAGEMATAVGAIQNGAEMPSLADVAKKVKDKLQSSELIASITDIVKPADGTSLVDAIKAMVSANAKANNENLIKSTIASFDESTKDLKPEVKDMVAMQYADILKANADNLPADFATMAEARLKTVPDTIKVVNDKMTAFAKASNPAGEMAMFDFGGQQNSGNEKSAGEMTDEELLKSLGY